MKLEQLEKITFPQDLEFSTLKYDDPYFSEGHLVMGLGNKSAIKSIVKVVEANYLTCNWDHAFTWSGQYIGGPNDGAMVHREYLIKTEDDFRRWLIRMALLKMPRMDTWGPKGKSYLDAWHDFRIIFMGQHVAMLTAPKDEYIFPISVATNQVNCYECGKTSPIFWTRYEINEWISYHEWLNIAEKKDSIKLVCTECGKKLLS